MIPIIETIELLKELSQDLFFPALKEWYQQNHRTLPWRQTQDPYLIWLSEIILQQTRVAQGLPYYERFVNRFPTVSDLAVADEDVVLRYWQGLGYYSRARNLHATAQLIHRQYKGVFPTDYSDIIALKGVGQYTAAAICSFAYGLAYAAVDGNLFRILSRYFELATPINTPKGKTLFTGLAQALIPAQEPALFNQAMMDLGALICTPQSPICNQCPLEAGCGAALHLSTAQYPQKLKKVEVKERFLHYLYLHDSQGVYLQQRASQDIWKGLYEFALVEHSSLLTLEQLLQKGLLQDILRQASYSIDDQPYDLTHKLTHQRLYIRIFKIEIHNGSPLSSLIKVPHEEIDSLPKPRPIVLFLETRT